MNMVVVIICAIQELTSAEFENNFKTNFTGTAADVYAAYETFRDSADTNTAYFENTLWNWYCELTR